MSRSCDRCGAWPQRVNPPSPLPEQARAARPEDSVRHPQHGYTTLGHAVHARVMDHHPDHTAYQRLNKRIAIALTSGVGTMSCFWVFCLLSLCALPATLVAAHIIPPTIGFIAALGFITVISWLSQSFIQLVLLPALMVGQTLQNEANDARSTKQFEDTERILDILDTGTPGGLSAILAAVDTLRTPSMAPPTLETTP